MPDIDFKKLFETLKSSGAQTSLLVALMGQVGTAIYFQIVNNERQEAAIMANGVALQQWKEQDANLNTAFGQQFVRLQEQVTEAIRRSEKLESPIGQRFLIMEDRVGEAIKTAQERISRIDRMADQLNQLTERMTIIDRRLFEIEQRLKEQQPK
jgi:hypothetical protein